MAYRAAFDQRPDLDTPVPDAPVEAPRFRRGIEAGIDAYLAALQAEDTTRQRDQPR